MPDLSVFFGLLGQLQLGSNPEFFQVLIKTGQCFFPIASINEKVVPVTADGGDGVSMGIAGFPFL